MTCADNLNILTARIDIALNASSDPAFRLQNIQLELDNTFAATKLHLYTYVLGIAQRKKTMQEVRLVLTYLNDLLKELSGEKPDGLLIHLNQKSQQELIIFIREKVYSLTKFIEVSFPDYLPLDLRISGLRASLFLEEIQPVRDQLLGSYNSTNTKLDPLLYNLLQDFLLRRGEFSSSLKTYHDLKYFKRLLIGLWNITGTIKLQEEVCDFLYQNNFNAAVFYDYNQLKIEALLEGLDHYQEKKMFLLELRKELRQLPKLLSEGHSKDSPHIIESLCGFIDEEVTSIVQKISDNGPTQNSSRFYFFTNLNVPEITYFYKLMLETKIISTARKADLYEFISNHIQTESRRKLSEHSIKNKSYKPDEKSIKKVRLKLREMLIYSGES